MSDGSSSNKLSYMEEALANMVQPTLSKDQHTKYIGEWLSEHTEIFENGKFKINGVEARYVVIFAGVGAGKTDFTTKVLPQYGKVYFNCSRTMIKNQQLEEIKESPVKNDVIIATSWDLINPKVYSIAEKSKYIVIDEAHHLVADSFTDAPSYAYELINNIRQEQTVIMMTACYDYFKDALDSKKSCGDYLRLPDYPTCVLDLRECCHNLHPKTIKIVTPIFASKILYKQNDNIKRIFFYSSARKAYKLACNLIVKSKRAVAITSSKQYLKPIIDTFILGAIKKEIKKMNKSNDLENAEHKDVISLNIKIVNKLINLNVLEETAEGNLLDGKFPEDVDYLIATSKLREGVNIKKTENIEVFTDVINLVDLVQIVGRIRKYGVPHNIDCLYIIAKKQMSFDDFRILDNQQIRYDENEIKRFNDFFKDKIRGEMEHQYGTDYYNRLVKPLGKKSFTNHRKRLKGLYKNINMATKWPGQLYLKPNRNDLTPVINTYSIQQNDLWFINNRLRLKDYAWSNPNSIFDVQPLVEKLKSVFKDTEIEVIEKYIVKPGKKAFKPDDKTKEIAKSIISEYLNHYINTDELKVVKTRLVEANYMKSDNYIGSVIKKIGYEGKWKTTKRQQFIITEMIKNDSVQ